MSPTDRQNRLLVAEDWKRIQRATEMQNFKAMTLIICVEQMINFLRKLSRISQRLY